MKTLILTALLLFSTQPAYADGSHHPKSHPTPKPAPVHSLQKPPRVFTPLPGSPQPPVQGNPQTQTSGSQSSSGTHTVPLCHYEPTTGNWELRNVQPDQVQKRLDLGDVLTDELCVTEIVAAEATPTTPEPLPAPVPEVVPTPAPDTTPESVPTEEPMPEPEPLPEPTPEEPEPVQTPSGLPNCDSFVQIPCGSK